MGVKIEITRELIEKAMHHPDVVAHLEVVANRVARHAESLAAKDGVDMDVWVQSGVRPKGRPQSVVYASNVDQEFGTAKTPRRRILGRAGEEAG